jgi:hypothetical protein
MNKLFRILRLPFFVAGIALLFFGDRYLSIETYHLALRISAFALMVLSLVMTFVLSMGAAAKSHTGEAKSWRKLVAWQVVVIASLGAYLLYRKSLGDAATPETVTAKIWLGVWLVGLVLGLFSAIGLEWAMRDTGHGPNAEPQRVGRSGLAWLSTGLFFGALIAFNYGAAKKNVTRDWSYLKIRTPSESSMNMVGTLTQDLSIALFYPQGNEVKTLVSEYFDAMKAKEPRVKVEYFDKDMNPAKAEEFKVSRNGQIVFDVGGKKSRIDTGTTISKARKTLKELDSQFQKSFLEITSERKTVYFTRGHGEMSWVGDEADNQLRSLRLLETFLRQQNYSTRLLGVAEGLASAIPDDASAVIIAGPTQPFAPEETAALKTYVEAGGNLMVLMDIESGTGESGVLPAGSTDPLAAMMAEMGLRYNKEPLANQKNSIAATRSPSDVWFIYSNIFTSHESVSSLSKHDERVALLYYQGGHFSVTPELGRWKTFETVRALSDTFIDLNRNFKKDDNEKADAYVMGAVAELKDPKAPAGADKNRKGRVVALGDATVIADALVRNVGNVLFFADSLKWLVGESETAGALASEEDVKIRHTRKEDAVWFHGTVIIVPALVLGAGFLATRRRKITVKKGDGNAA